MPLGLGGSIYYLFGGVVMSSFYLPRTFEEYMVERRVKWLLKPLWLRFIIICGRVIFRS